MVSQTQGTQRNRGIPGAQANPTLLMLRRPKRNLGLSMLFLPAPSLNEPQRFRNQTGSHCIGLGSIKSSVERLAGPGRRYLGGNKGAQRTPSPRKCAGAVGQNEDEVLQTSLADTQSQPQNHPSPCRDQPLPLHPVGWRLRMPRDGDPMRSCSCTMFNSQSKHIRREMTWKETQDNGNRPARNLDFEVCWCRFLKSLSLTHSRKCTTKLRILSDNQ